MSMHKEYEITISKDGKIHVESQGFKGKTCMDFIKFLEQEGVGKITTIDYKKEYYVHEEESEKITQHTIL
ncbi:MAG: DUF2997 domain-containing protein [bacterium]